MILGPVVQKFAFNEFWAGVPFGIDLTDNKTLIAMIAWLLALWKSKNVKSGRYWVIAAAIILLAVQNLIMKLCRLDLEIKAVPFR